MPAHIEDSAGRGSDGAGKSEQRERDHWRIGGRKESTTRSRNSNSRSTSCKTSRSSGRRPRWPNWTSERSKRVRTRPLRSASETNAGVTTPDTLTTRMKCWSSSSFRTVTVRITSQPHRNLSVESGLKRLVRPGNALPELRVPVTDRQFVPSGPIRSVKIFFWAALRFRENASD